MRTKVEKGIPKHNKHEGHSPPHLVKNGLSRHVTGKKKKNKRGIGRRSSGLPDEEGTAEEDDDEDDRHGRGDRPPVVALLNRRPFFLILDLKCLWSDD